MTKIKAVFSVMLFLSLCFPAFQTVAQETAGTESSVSSTMVDETATDVKEKKSDKKKNKDKDSDKDVVEINSKFFIFLLINVATLALIILLVYSRGNKKIDTVFTLIMFNLMIFLLTFVLNKVKISMGAAFGLFAVFSMLRYRTEGISMKDMTYLFIFIAVGLISAIQLEYYELGIINGIIIVFTFILDGNIIFRHELSLIVEYENIELINSKNQQELIDDLKKRTGLNIHRINIEKMNFLRDTAAVRIYYYKQN